MPLAGQVAKQVSKLLTRGSSKFLREQETLAVPTLQHSPELPAWEPEPLYNTGLTIKEILADIPDKDIGSIAPMTDEISSLEDLSKISERELTEKQKRKLARPWAHGVRPKGSSEVSPLKKGEEYLTFRHEIDLKRKSADDIANEITDKYSLKRILETSARSISKYEKEYSKNYPHLSTYAIQNMFRFLTPIDYSRGKRKGMSKKEIIFDSNKVTLLSDEILVERNVLKNLRESFGDLNRNTRNLENIIKSSPDFKDGSLAYYKVNVNDFVGLAKDYREVGIQQSTFDPLSTAAHITEETPSEEYLEGIVRARDIPEEWWRLSPLERMGFIKGKSHELNQEGTSLSFDPLLSFTEFAREDLDRMFYVDLPKNIKPEDIVNLKPIDYIIPEEKSGLIFKPNVFTEKELFVTAEGGFREALKPRRLTEKERKELLQFNKAYEDVDKELTKIQQISRNAPEIIGGQMVSRIKNIFPSQYIGDTAGQTGPTGIPIDLGYDYKLADIDTLLDDLDSRFKDNQKILIQLTRSMSKISNQFKKLQGNPVAITKKFIALTPSVSLKTSQNILHDIVATEKAKEYLTELKGFIAYVKDNHIKAVNYRQQAHKDEAYKPGNKLIEEYFKAENRAMSQKEFKTIFNSPDKRDALRVSDLRLGTPTPNKIDDHYALLENIDNPLLTKFFVLSDVLATNKKAERKFNDFSDMIKEKRGAIASETYDPGVSSTPVEIERKQSQLKKDNSSRLTKLWSDYNKSSAVALEFILKNFGYAMGGVVDMRSGGRVRMVQGGDTNKIPDVTMKLDPKTPGKNIEIDIPEEREFDPSLTNKFWQERYEKEVRKIELEKIYARRAAKKLAETEKSIGASREEARQKAREVRKQAGEQLSETEKAFVLVSKGNRKALEYMYDYGLHRKDRLSQVEAGYKFREDALGTFNRQTKKIFVTPRRDVTSEEKESYPTWDRRFFDRWKAGKKPRPFVGETLYPETDATIQTEQHEFTHAFLDMLRHAVKDEELLSTLSKKDKLKLFKHMDFMQKQLFTPSGERKRSMEGDLIFYDDVEHRVMDQPARSKIVSVKEGQPYDHPLGGTKPELIYTEDVLPPKKDEPTIIGPGEGYDPSIGKGIAKQTTINDIAKAFIRASTKTSASAEIHKRFLKDWRKQGYIRHVPTTEFEEAIKQLQGTEQQEQLQQQQDSSNQKKGGKIGAAVVAASLMASGGQAMDMRNGGVVGMADGGRAGYEARKGFSPETEQARKHITRVADAPDAYQIKHITGLPLEIFNRNYDRLIKSGLVDPGQRQQALENFDHFTQDIFKIESSENWTAEHPKGASGAYQFKPETIPPTITRLKGRMKNYPFGSWIKEILVHKKAGKLLPEQQTALFVTNMFERSLRDKNNKIIKGAGDKLLVGVMEGDKGDMIDAYYRLHYAGDPDWKTRFRANTMLRFEKEGEDRIFNFAKQMRKLLPNLLN